MVASEGCFKSRLLCTFLSSLGTLGTDSCVSERLIRAFGVTTGAGVCLEFFAAMFLASSSLAGTVVAVETPLAPKQAHVFLTGVFAKVLKVRIYKSSTQPWGQKILVRTISLCL